MTQTVDYLALVRALAQRHPAPVTVDPTLPVCPLCGAGAVAGVPYTSYESLTHDCNCAVDAPAEYQVKLRRLWNVSQAPALFLHDVPEEYRAYSFSTLTMTPAKAPVVRALRRADGQNVFIFGDPGVGKTELAVAAGRAYAERGVSTRWWSANELVTALREHTGMAMAGLKLNERPAKPDLRTPRVLILDDLGKLKGTDFVYSEIYNALEWRATNGRTTIITAQHDPGGVALILTPGGDEDAAGALASRMGKGHVFEVRGDDCRYKSAPPSAPK